MMTGYGGYGYGHMLGYGGFGLGWIFMIIIWVLVIWAIVVFVRAASGKSGSSWGVQEKEDSAARILKERYAKGEINKEEFEQKRKDIENMK